MKTIHLLLALAPFTSFAQILGDYHPLPVPQTELLGRQLQELNLKRKIIRTAPSASFNKLTFEEFAGPANIKIYTEKANHFILPAFNRNKLRVVDVKIDSLKIRTINAENFTNGKILPSVFAYDGIVADTIRVTCRTSVNWQGKPSEILDALPGGTSIGGLSIVKKITIGGKDSLERVITLVNPEVIFAARFVKFKEINPRSGKDFEKKYKVFAGTGVTNLSIEDDDDDSAGEKRTPQYRGGDDDLSHQYFFKVIGEENNLRLIFAVDDRNNESEGYRVVREIPYKDKNGMRVFKLGYRTVDRYTDSFGNFRFIRIAVSAKQTNSNTIQIENRKTLKRKATYMKYPYCKFEYVDKI